MRIVPDAIRFVKGNEGVDDKTTPGIRQHDHDARQAGENVQSSQQCKITGMPTISECLLTDLLVGRISSLKVTADGQVRADDPPQGALLSGSFNPLHWGHKALATAAARHLGVPVAFELPVLNADKGVLDNTEVQRRAAQFAVPHTLILSRAPRFIDKAALYPSRTFILGYDTAVRLLDPRYYDGTAGLAAALATLHASGSRFLVAGREIDGRFATLAEITIPSAYAHLFVDLPETAFRADVSSTELRRKR
jgi:hypothetical protein